jgi:predicted metalloprotease
MSAQEAPEVMATATCAHEFGHIVQYKHNLIKRLEQGQPTVKRSELHADFLAGYFAGTRKLQKPDYPAAVFATSRYVVGDFAEDKDHHGTPEERAAAVVRGFETAYRERRSFSDAIQIGQNYVSRL